MNQSQPNSRLNAAMEFEKALQQLEDLLEEKEGHNSGVTESESGSSCANYRTDEWEEAGADLEQFFDEQQFPSPEQD